MTVHIPPRDENPHILRVLREGRRARLQYEETRGKGERAVRISDPNDPHFDRLYPGEETEKPCSCCGDPIELARVLLGCVSCGACSPHKGVIRP